MVRAGDPVGSRGHSSISTAARCTARSVVIWTRDRQTADNGKRGGSGGGAGDSRATPWGVSIRSSGSHVPSQLPNIKAAILCLRPRRDLSLDALASDHGRQLGRMDGGDAAVAATCPSSQAHRLRPGQRRASRVAFYRRPTLKCCVGTTASAEWGLLPAWRPPGVALVAARPGARTRRQAATRALRLPAIPAAALTSVRIRWCRTKWRRLKCLNQACREATFITCPMPATVPGSRRDDDGVLERPDTHDPRRRLARPAPPVHLPADGHRFLDARQG